MDPLGILGNSQAKAYLLLNSRKFPLWLIDFPRFTTSLETGSSHPKYSCCLCWKTVTQAIGSKSLLGEKREGLTGPTYDSIAGHFLKEDLQSSHPTEDICRVFQGGSAHPPSPNIAPGFCEKCPEPSQGMIGESVTHQKSTPTFLLTWAFGLIPLHYNEEIAHLDFI